LAFERQAGAWPAGQAEGFEAGCARVVHSRLGEIAEHLAVERGVKASLTTIHEFFAKRGITYKKRRRMRPNSSAQMFWQREKNGSKASSISIRAV
jgi:transposase